MSRSSELHQNQQVVSYMTIRKSIGFLGIFLPVILIIGSFISSDATSIAPSISDYYFTTMGDVFVGTLCAVALFMFCYKGCDKRDERAANLAAFFAVVTALFPTSTDFARVHLGLIANEKVASVIHFTAATLLFSTLAYFCLRLFVLSKGYMTIQKKRRNRIYRICGWIIIGCLITLAVLFLFPGLESKVIKYRPVIILETVMLWAFGLSWLTKSEAIVSDNGNFENQKTDDE